MAELRVPGAALLKEGKTQTFELNDKNQRTGFVIRYAGELLAYLNECPHWSVDLDLGTEEYFEPELKRIHCKNHGALFVLPSGECETGPCLGRSLDRYQLKVEGDDVLVEV